MAFNHQKSVEKMISPQRNYQLDVWKFIFTIFVFFYHSKAFFGPNTKMILPKASGWVAVHFFFIISGLLMVNSAVKYDDIDAPGRKEMEFVLHKFKAIALPYWVSLFLYAGCLSYLKGDYSQIPKIFSKIIPEFFAITGSGVGKNFNEPTWYISAMLLLPIIVAIAFSEKSYFSKLFRLNLFRYLNKISLAIYLNQWAAWKVVSMRFGGHSYKFCLAMMAVLTLAFSVAYFIILKIFKLLWEKKLKGVFCCSK